MRWAGLQHGKPVTRLVWLQFLAAQCFLTDGLSLVCSSSCLPPLYLFFWVLQAQGGCLSALLCATSSLPLTAESLKSSQKWPLPGNKVAHSHGKLWGTVHRPRPQHPRRGLLSSQLCCKGQSRMAQGSARALETGVLSEPIVSFPILGGRQGNLQAGDMEKRAGPQQQAPKLPNSMSLVNRGP